MKFDEDHYQDFSANVILENLYKQIDDEGKSHSLLKGIVSHRKSPNALPKEDSWFECKSCV